MVSEQGVVLELAGFGEGGGGERCTRGFVEGGSDMGKESVGGFHNEVISRPPDPKRAPKSGIADGPAPAMASPTMRLFAERLRASNGPGTLLPWRLVWPCVGLVVQTIAKRR